MDLTLENLDSRPFHTRELRNLHCVTAPLSLPVVFGQMGSAIPTLNLYQWTISKIK